jgi:glutaconate CoA-transferase subunit B
MQLHPGVTRAEVSKATAWEIQFAETLGETPAPTPVELETLRDLERRTKLAHGNIAAAQT